MLSDRSLAAENNASGRFLGTGNGYSGSAGSRGIINDHPPWEFVSKERMSDDHFRKMYLNEMPVIIVVDPAKPGSDQVSIRCVCGKMRDVNVSGRPHIPCWSCGL